MNLYKDKIDDYYISNVDTENDFNNYTKNDSSYPIFDIPIYCLHGNMDHNDRLGYIDDFIKKKSAILISTDVASRGLNLSNVDRVIQYDPPQQLEEYIHRSGRTARIGGKGNAILILIQHEYQFTDRLRNRGVNMKQIMEGVIWSYIEQIYLPKHLRNFMGDLIGFIRNSFCYMVKINNDLHESAKKAFKASIQSYKTYSKELRSIFNFKKLHLGHYATSFCLSQKPTELVNIKKSNLNVKIKENVNKHGDNKKIYKMQSDSKYKSKKTKQKSQLPTTISEAGLKAVEYLKSKNALLIK